MRSQEAGAGVKLWTTLAGDLYMRQSIRILSTIMIAAIVFRAASVFGITVRAREEFGTIQSIDFQTRRLTVNPARDVKPLTLVWNSWTQFLQDSHVTTVERLKRGMQITVYYHSPFFGDRFATKISWATSVPIAEGNARPHRAAAQDKKRALTR